MGRIILPQYTPRYVPNGEELAIITTSKGTVTVKLDGKNAPITTGNFIELSRRGFYDNLKFHAYRADSAILGGCPITRTLGPAQVDDAVRGGIHGIHPGRGDAQYVIKDEYHNKPDNHHRLGSLVFAHKSEPDSGSCQFYFSLAEQPEQDDKFVVFGQTVEGLDTVESLRVGDVILDIEIKGADEAALEEAVSHDTPRPERTATDVYHDITAKRKAAKATAEQLR